MGGKPNELRAPITNKVSGKIKNEAITNKDRERKATEGWDLRKGITVTSVWVAASADDLIGNDTSHANTLDLRQNSVDYIAIGRMRILAADGEKKKMFETRSLKYLTVQIG